MRLDNEKPDYDSIEDRRGQGGGFGFPGGRRGGINIPSEDPSERPTAAE